MKVSFLLLLLCVIAVYSQYNPAVSRQLAIYSVMVYEPEAPLKSWSCAKCNLYQLNDRSTWYEKSQNLFGMIGYSPKLKAIVIAFRGTQPKSKKNIATDLNFDDVDYSNCNGCKVHKGFYEAFRLQQKLVEQNLNSLVKKYPNTPIHVTGHSLGGAVATLTAAHLSLNRKYKLAQVYTFGEPRVGNKKFADWFNSRITEYRVIHFKDIVPNLPPRNNYIKRILGAHYVNSKSLHSMRLQSHQGLWNFEYHREGTQVWFTPDMKNYRICKGEDMSCFNSIKTLNPMDHLSKFYLEVPESGSPVAHFSATNQNIHH